MGDLHDETVLYLDEASGEYQIHTYSNQFGGPEIHRGYRADKEVYDQIFALIRKLGLDKCQGGRDNGMCGGEYVCKFVLDEGIVDGHYWAQFLLAYRYMFQHPDILVTPPSRVVEDVD